MAEEMQAYKFFQEKIQEAVAQTFKNRLPGITGYSFVPLVREGGDKDNTDDWIGVQYVYEARTLNPRKLQIIGGEEQFGVGLNLKSYFHQESGLHFPEFRGRWLKAFRGHPDQDVFYQVMYLASILNQNNFECRAAAWEDLLSEEERNNEPEGLTFPVLHFYEPLEAWTCVVHCQPIIRR